MIAPSRDGLSHRRRGVDGPEAELHRKMNRLAQLLIDRSGALWAFVAFVTALAAAGVARVRFDSDPRVLFRSSDESFARLEAFNERFGPDDQDSVLVVSHDDLFSPESIAALRACHKALAADPDVEAVFSLFSAKKPGPIPLPLIPEEDFSIEQAGELRRRCLEHPVVRGQFLSDDGRSAILSVRLRGRNLTVEQLTPILDRLDGTAERTLAPARMSYQFGGHPEMRIMILQTLQSEVFRFAAIGAVISGGIAVFVFRNFAALAVAMAGPSLGVFWSLGAIGWLGGSIDPLSVILPTLLFVVAFTDSVHLIHECVAARARGLSGGASAADAVRRIGPACVLTAITTMTGFGSLVIADSDCIRRFGGTCALGVMITAACVLLVVPLLTTTRFGRRITTPDPEEGNRSFPYLRSVYVRLLRRPRLVAAASVGFTCYCFFTSLQLESDIRWLESLPQSSNISGVTRKCDEAFGGAFLAYVVLQWPEESSLHSPGVLNSVREIHSIARGQSGLTNPLSIASVLDSLRYRDQSVRSQVDGLQRMPEHVRRLFVRPDLRQAVVSFHVPDVGAAALAPQFSEVERRLAEFEAGHPGFRAELTGTVVVAARNVHRIIEDLGRCLTLASVVIFGMMVVLFRSIFLGLLSIVPNVFPQAVTACVLVWLGEPLTITSVLTFSLCLGLSVDDTVHFLMRFNEEKVRVSDLTSAVRAAFDGVGTTMIATSFVLIGGFAAMLISQMPGIRQFAVLSCTTLAAALLGDLVMLPALLLSFPKLSRRSAASVIDGATSRSSTDSSG